MTHRSYKDHLPLLILLLGTIVLIPGCNFLKEEMDNVFDGRISEGEVHYEVSFPYSEDEGLMKTMLPDEMTMQFKDDVYLNEVSAGMGMFETRFMADCKEPKKLTQMLKVMNNKTYLELDREGTKDFLKDFPDMTVVKTWGIDSIAGYPCKRAVGIYHAVDKAPVIIYYTDQINIQEPNWCNQYNELNGVLMYYELERFGKRMRVQATSVTPKEIKKETFSKEGYKEVSPEKMKAKMEELVKSFNS